MPQWWRWSWNWCAGCEWAASSTNTATKGWRTLIAIDWNYSFPLSLICKISASRAKMQIYLQFSEAQPNLSTVSTVTYFPWNFPTPAQVILNNKQLDKNRRQLLSLRRCHHIFYGWTRMSFNVDILCRVISWVKFKICATFSITIAKLGSTCAKTFHIINIIS